TSIFSWYTLFSIFFVRLICSNISYCTSFILPDHDMEEAAAVNSIYLFSAAAFSKSTFDSPKDSLFSDPDIHCRPFPVSAFHWKSATDDTLHGTCKSRNPQSIPPSAVCCNSCLQT